MQSHGNALRFVNLSKTYRERGNRKDALKNISFDVPAGEIFGFLGPNGAGKTTAMHILMDFIFPTAGQTEILGRNSRDPESRRAIGFLPEIFNFDGFLTGNRFLDLFARLGHADKSRVSGRARELLDWLDLPDAGAVRIRNYSKGMTQKIGLAQALIADPQVLVLDEPTSGMDPIAKDKVKRLLIKLRSEGKTVFLSTHILSDIEDIADRVAIINRGELLAVDTLDRLLREGSRAFAITARGVSDAVLAELGGVGIIKTDACVTINCGDRAAKDRTLMKLVMSGAEVIELKPLAASLLDKFVDLVSGQESGA